MALSILPLLRKTAKYVPTVNIHIHLEQESLFEFLNVLQITCHIDIAIFSSKNPIIPCRHATVHFSSLRSKVYLSHKESYFHSH